jgi:elongin-A
MHKKRGQYVLPSQADIEYPANTPGLFDVGDFEYWKIKHVLARIQIPEQLHQIEINCPQIAGEDAPLWHAFIARDIPNWKTKNYVPKNPQKWYQIYLKYKREQAAELARDEEILRKSLADINKRKATNVSKIVELRKLPKVPRDAAMMSHNGGVPIGRRETGVIKRPPSSLTWTAGSKTKMTDGKSVMASVRREANDMAQRGRLIKPTAQLGGSLKQISKAPAGMVDQHRRERLPEIKPPVKILSRKKSNAMDKNSPGPSLEERENRLRAMTMSRGNTAGVAEANYAGSSDDEDGCMQASDLEDLFDERPAPPKPKSRPVPSSSRTPAVASSARPAATARPQPRQTPPAAAPRPKPSDIISSMISKPRPKPSPHVSPSPRSSTSTPTSMARSPSPSEGKKPLGMIKRRAPADIFNRGASKKPRTR